VLLLGATEGKSVSPETPADVSDILHTRSKTWLHIVDMNSLVLQYFPLLWLYFSVNVSPNVLLGTVIGIVKTLMKM